MPALPSQGLTGYVPKGVTPTAWRWCKPYHARTVNKVIDGAERHALEQQLLALQQPLESSDEPRQAVTEQTAKSASLK